MNEDQRLEVAAATATAAAAALAADAATTAAKASANELRRKLRPLFDALDVDRSGGVTREEACRMLLIIDPTCETSEERVEAIMAEAGVPPQGSVGFEAFCALILANKAKASKAIASGSVGEASGTEGELAAFVKQMSRSLLLSTRPEAEAAEGGVVVAAGASPGSRGKQASKGLIPSIANPMRSFRGHRGTSKPAVYEVTL
uniref:EF-hand domain-containing protein n=1 Tax=Haptolina brevifila TaxID=156173 RepID=A0A7S2G6J9_9EUKA|mmetsp:Transcript_28010/g.56412  ORF Transcript_28010/g.56412 Transcript_28010/m.56412 type:complete len:202 (+) Transcript_28010:746-1351(+)